MVTLEIAGQPGMTQTNAYAGIHRQSKAYRQADETIARYQTPRGLAGLAVIIMDLFVRLDPR